MNTRPNLRAMQILSLLVWVLYFSVGFLINFTFLYQYYWLIWTVSSLIALIPYLYWAYLPLKFAKEMNEVSKLAIYYKASIVVLLISFLLIVFSFSSPDALEEFGLQAVPNIGGVLFFGALITCFIFGSRTLVLQERRFLQKNSNNFLAFIMFFYLPIGIFFLVGRMKALYDSSWSTFD